MRKISRICRQRCNHYPAFFAQEARTTQRIIGTFILFMTVLLLTPRAEGIELPAPPAEAPPPVIPRAKDPALLRIKARDEKAAADMKREDVEQKSEQSIKTEEKAKAEAQKPRPLYGFMELSLVQPKAIVSAGRSKYISDITSHMSAYVRTFWNAEADAIQPWIGIRVAPFGGYGTQGKLTARFAHTYMGPAIGVGSVAKAADPSVDYPVRYGWLFSGGVAAVSRLVADDESAPPLPEDFRPTPWAFDSPGVWSELRWIRVSQGAFGLGAMAGFQTGKGKIFAYGGVIISGFY